MKETKGVSPKKGGAFQGLGRDHPVNGTEWPSVTGTLGLPKWRSRMETTLFQVPVSGSKSKSVMPPG
jgi:hypothetical protein